MLLTMKTIQYLINRDRNQSAIASKIGLGQGTINQIARCKDIDSLIYLNSTQKKLSDYFIAEYDYIKNVIFNLRGD